MRERNGRKKERSSGEGESRCSGPFNPTTYIPRLASLNLDAISRRYAAANAIFINPREPPRRAVRNIDYSFLRHLIDILFSPSSRRAACNPFLPPAGDILWEREGRTARDSSRIRRQLYGSFWYPPAPRPDRFIPGNKSVLRYTCIGMRPVPPCPLYFVNHTQKKKKQQHRKITIGLCACIWCSRRKCIFMGYSP